MWVLQWRWKSLSLHAARSSVLLRSVGFLPHGPRGDFATPTDVDDQVFERLFDAVFETFLLPPNRALSFDRILHTEAALKVGCQAFW